MRRLNVRWLVGIVISPIMLVVLGFLLHSFQMKRNASVFVREAKRAQSEGRPEEAVKHLGRYVKLAPNDSEGLILYGFQLADLNIVGPAYFALEKAILQVPDRADVRRRLVELSLKLGRITEAKDHLEKYLIKKLPDDSELLELLATCQFQQDDFEGAKASLVSAIKNGPDRVTTYVRLASLLNEKFSQSKEASDLIGEMVLHNSDSPRAYLFRAEWRLRELLNSSIAVGAKAEQEQDPDKRRIDIENDVKRALELAPDSTETLLVASRVLQTFGRTEEARKLIKHGIDVLPKETQFFTALAELESADGNAKAAAEALKRGVAASPKDVDLKWRLANRLIETENDAGANELIQELRASRYPEALIGYLEGQQLVRRNDWPAAITKLESLRFPLRERPLLEKQIEFWLGIAYRETSSPDQALTSFRRAEALDPNWTQAKIAAAESLAATNKSDEAILEYRQICSQPDAPIAAMLGLERAILQSNLSRTPEQRNWTEFDSLLKKIEQDETQQAQVVLLKTQRFIADGKQPEAEKTMELSLENNSDQIEVWNVLINLAQNRRDWDRAQKLIQDVEKQFGDTVSLRRLKGRLITLREPPEKARDLLRPLSQPALDWQETQKIQLASEFAWLFLTVGDYGEAEKLSLFVNAAVPKNLPIQLMLLDIATRTNQLKLMNRVVDEVHETTGDGALWHYGQARMMTMVGDESKDVQRYADAISHLEKAVVIRPTWERIHTLWAEILEKKGDTGGATEQYLKAIELGENSVNVSNRTLALLLNSRRYEDADKLLRLLRKSQSPFTIEMLQAEVDLAIQFGRRDQALKLLEPLSQGSERNRNSTWLGRVYFLLEKYDRAEEQFQMAVKANGKAAGPWIGLVQTLVRAKQPEKAAAAIEEAKTAIESDLAMLAVGQCYEILGNFELAGEAYQTGIQRSPENFEIRQRWIEFLLRSNAPGQAEVALRKILVEEAGLSEGEQTNREWARQRLIDALRLQGGRDNLKTALELIDDQIKQSKTESLEDLRKKAQILAMYPTRKERGDAIKILEKIVDQEPVVANQLEERWQLAGLYQLVGDPTRSRAELRKILSSRKDDLRSLTAYIELCLQAKEFSEAEIYLNSLKKLAPDESSTADVEIQVLFARKKYAEIVNLLKTIAVRKVAIDDPSASARKESWIARWYSTISNRLAQEKRLEECNQFNLEAEKFYKKLSEAKSEESTSYAEFLAVTPEIDRSLKLIKENSADLTFARIQRIVRTAMTNPQVTPEQLAEFQELLNTREVRSEESIPLALLAADLLSWRGEYKAAADKFREVLRVDKKNIVALNNLAFLMALSGDDLLEAQRLVEQAIEMGEKIGAPMDAIYDTLGFVRLAAGNADAAVLDFERSITESETVDRRIHSAQAYFKLKNIDAAKKALMRADEIGIVENEFHPIERRSLSKLRTELNLPERSK